MSTSAEELRALIDQDWAGLAFPGDEWDGWTVVDVVEGDDGRWSRINQVILKHESSGDFYRYEYEKGLTEYQETELCDGLPTRVYPHEQVITIREWKVQP